MLEIASKLCEDEKYMEAVKQYDKILQIESDNIVAIIDYGVTLQNLGQYNEALAMYEMVLNIQPKNVTAIINMGSTLHTLERYSEAISCYDVVLNIEKNNPIALAYKGLCIGEIGDVKLAAKYFKKALSIDNEYELAEISLHTANDIIKSR